MNAFDIGAEEMIKEALMGGAMRKAVAGISKGKGVGQLAKKTKTMIPKANPGKYKGIMAHKAIQSGGAVAKKPGLVSKFKGMIGR